MNDKYDRLTKREREMVDMIARLAFYIDHDKNCSLVYHHLPKQYPCDCNQHKAFKDANKILRRYGLHYG